MRSTPDPHAKFLVLGWFVVGTLLVLWSLAAWALHGVAVWTLSSAGALADATTGVGAFSVPAWLAPWVPAELVQVATWLMTGLRPGVEGLVRAAPALAGGLTVVAWVLWALGGLLLLLLGAGMHLLIALRRRRGAGGSGPDAGPSLATG